MRVGCRGFRNCNIVTSFLRISPIGSLASLPFWLVILRYIWDLTDLPIPIDELVRHSRVFAHCVHLTLFLSLTAEFDTYFVNFVCLCFLHSRYYSISFLHYSFNAPRFWFISILRPPIASKSPPIASNRLQSPPIASKSPPIASNRLQIRLRLRLQNCTMAQSKELIPSAEAQKVSFDRWLFAWLINVDCWLLNVDYCLHNVDCCSLNVDCCLLNAIVACIMLIVACLM